ncbi:uncharacterized protein TNCV_2781461 [Trichonephila clavipes]|nr:uncharacterized protein TNCV_2781461 [Trichonephila clavipes]
MLTYLSSARVVSRHIRGPISRQLHTTHTIIELDSVGNENLQTRQRVSSHQQSNVGVDGPRRGVKLCVGQSTRVHEWVFGSESPYRWCFVEWFMW